MRSAMASAASPAAASPAARRMIFEVRGEVVMLRPVQREGALEHWFDAKTPFDGALRVLAHHAAEGGIKKEFGDGFGDGFGVFRRHEPAGDSVLDEIGNPAHARPYCWQSCGHGFHERVGKAF